MHSAAGTWLQTDYPWQPHVTSVPLQTFPWPALLRSHWKSSTCRQHLREGRARSEPFVKKAKQFQSGSLRQAETSSGAVNLRVGGGLVPRNRQPKPSLSMHEISHCDQIRANHRKGVIMKGSADLATNLVEWRIVFQNCVNVKNSSGFSTIRRVQRRNRSSIV